MDDLTGDEAVLIQVDGSHTKAVLLSEIYDFMRGASEVTIEENKIIIDLLKRIEKLESQVQEESEQGWRI